MNTHAKFQRAVVFCHLQTESETYPLVLTSFSTLVLSMFLSILAAITSK